MDPLQDGIGLWILNGCWCWLDAEIFSDRKEIILEFIAIVKNDFPGAWIACQPGTIKDLADPSTGFVWDLCYFKPTSCWVHKGHGIQYPVIA